LILHLNNAKTWRGGEQQLYYLALGLKEKAISQIIVGQPDSELQERLSDQIDFIPVKMKGGYDLVAVFNLIKICKKYKVQIIHAHTANAHSLAFLLKLFLPKLFLIVSRRVDFRINKNAFSKIKYTSKKIDYILCVSNTIKNILFEDGVSPEKLLTVYSGIDLNKFKDHKIEKNIREEYSISKDTILIGNVAALVDHKDQRTLLKSIPYIETNKKYIFLIIGEGELELELKQLAIDLDISDKVIFTGYKKNILDYYSAMDIFTLTSKEEGLGTSVLDAMSAGLPIIATRGGGISEMLEENSGSFLCEVGDSAKLGESFTLLIENKKIREEFSKLNLEKVKLFSVENTIEKTLTVYNSLLGTLS
jgi:L-malate glycosyltransferase